MTKRALVVDDSPEMRGVAEVFLEHLGFIVTCAAGGQEGLELYQSGSYDIVVTDWEMSVMDGFELARSIFEINPDQPLIIASGNHDVVLKADDCNMRALKKPYKLETFTRAVRLFFDS